MTKEKLGSQTLWSIALVRAGEEKGGLWVYVSLNLWQTFQAITFLRVHPVFFRSHKLEYLQGQYKHRTWLGMRQNRVRGAQETAEDISLKTS